MTTSELLDYIRSEAAKHAAADEEDSFIWEGIEQELERNIIVHAVEQGEILPDVVRRWGLNDFTEDERDADDEAASSHTFRDHVWKYLDTVLRSGQPPLLAMLYRFYSKSLFPDMYEEENWDQPSVE